MVPLVVPLDEGNMVCRGLGEQWCQALGAFFLK